LTPVASDNREAPSGFGNKVDFVLKPERTAMKTHVVKASEIQKQWILIDAEGLVVGRLASVIANRLRGKHKTTFTPSMDCGDNVIVINCEKVLFTGKKRQQKRYYWHTGFPGGIKDRTADFYLDGKHPDRVIEAAVRRMLPGTSLKRQQLTNLRIFKGSEHPHEAQNPVKLDVKAMNAKNSERA
jgi:large subunit ribosomal protein L13